MAAMYGPGGEYMGEVDDTIPQDVQDNAKKFFKTSPGRSAKTAGASVVQIPSMIAQSMDLARQLPNTAYRFTERLRQQALPEDLVNNAETISDRLAILRGIPSRLDVGDAALKALSDSQFASNDSDVAVAEIQKATEDYLAKNPSVTEQEKQEFIRQQTNDRKAFLPKWTERYDRKTNDLIGAPQPEERSGIENVIYGATPALLPGSKKLGGTFMDYVDPRTTNFTPGGIAINATVGGALTAALAPETPEQIAERTAAKPINESGTLAQLPEGFTTPEGKPIVAIDTSETAQEEKTSQEIGNETAAKFLTPTLAMAMFGFAWRGGPRTMPGNIASEMADRAVGGVVHGGPPRTNVAEQSLKASAKQAFDEQSVPTDEMIRAGLPGKTARANQSDLTQHVRHAQAQKVDMWRKSGYLPDGKQTHSWMEFFNLKQEVAAKYGPERADMLDTYIAAKQRRADYDEQLRSTQQAISDGQANINYLRSQLPLTNLTVQKRNDIYRQIAETQQKILEKQDDLRKIITDDPAARTSMRDISLQKIDDYISEGDNIPEFKTVHEKLLKVYRDDLDFQVRANLLDPMQAAIMKQTGYVMPLYNDPISKNIPTPATGAKRVWLNIKDKFQKNENPYGDPGDAAVARSFGPMRKKDLGVDKENAVENPVNWLDALDLHMERMIRYSQRMDYQRKLVDNILTGPRWKDVLTLHTDRGGNPLVSRDWLKWALNNDKSSLYHKKDSIIILPRGNDLYQVVEPKNSALHHVMQQTPLMSVPVLREMSTAFKMATTGILRPAFAPTSFLYDTRTININRPYGSIQGTDAVVSRLAQAAGANVPDSLAHSIRMISTNYDPSLYLLGAEAAIKSYVRQNQLRIGRAFSDGLTSNSMLFRGLAQVPGMQPMLQQMGQQWVKNYSDSLYHALSHQAVANNFELTNIFNARREFESIISARLPKWARVVGSPATELYAQYRMMMSSIESAARVSYAMQNVQMLAAKRYNGDWTQIPQKEFQKILNDARTMGGDFARKPGSEFLQKVDSSVPYFNVMVQTTAAMGRRALDNPLVWTTAFAGALVPKVYSEYMMSNWDDAALQYWYNDTPEFKRVSTILLPKPQVMMEFARTGKMPPFTPDSVWQFTVVPEMRPLTAPVAEAMRAMGMFGPNSNRLAKTPDAELVMTVLAEGLKQTYGVAAPPVINGMALGAGTKVDLGNIFNILPRLAGADPNAPANTLSPFGPSMGGTARGGAGLGGAVVEEPMNPHSTISKFTHQLVSTVFGANVGVGLQAFDTGVQNFQRGGKNLADAVFAGLQEFGQREKQYLQKDSVPGVWDAATRVYRKNATSDEIKEFNKAIGVVSGRNAVVSGLVGNPVLDQITSQLRYSLRNDWNITKQRKEFKEINQKINNIDGNKLLTYEQREQAKIPLLKSLQEVNARQLESLRNLQDRYAKTWGPKYQAQFGVPFSFKDFSVQVVKADRRKKAQMP